jgi:hypothetical protein
VEEEASRELHAKICEKRYRGEEREREEELRLRSVDGRLTELSSAQLRLSHVA